MMNFKRSVAMLLIVSVCLTLCSCGYNPKTVGTITDPDGNVINITCGEYLCAQYEVTVGLLNEAEVSGEIDIEKFLDTWYDGGTVREYISQRVSEILLQKAVTDYLYDRTDLGDDVATTIYFDNYVQNEWSTNRDALIRNGIGFDSFKKYEIQSLKSAQLPYDLYGEGGEQELSREYVEKFIKNGVARFTYLSLPYRKVMGVDVTDEEKKELRSYATQILKACEEAEIPAHGSVKGVIASAAEEFSTNYQNMLGYVQDMESITYENERMVTGDGKFTAQQYAQMFGAKVGEYVMVDGGDGLYTIAYRQELDPETDNYDSLINEIIAVVASERFQSYLDENAKGFTIELDKKAAKYYSPEKIVF